MGLTAPHPPKSLFTKIGKRKSRRFETLNLADLKVDLELQRMRNAAQVNKLEAKFDPLYLGTIVVSRRADGSLYIIDGQHRVEVMLRKGMTTVDCEVYEGLTTTEEADMFLNLNENRKAVAPYDSFRVSLSAGRKWAVRMDAEVKACGLEVSPSSSANKVGAVMTCKRIVELDKAGTALLTDVLHIAEAAWGRTQESWDGMVIEGIAIIIHRNRANIDMSRLTSTLQKKVVTQWIASAIAQTSGGGGSSSRPLKFAEVVVTSYNTGLRTASKKLALK